MDLVPSSRFPSQLGCHRVSPLVRYFLLLEPQPGLRNLCKPHTPRADIRSPASKSLKLVGCVLVRTSSEVH